MRCKGKLSRIPWNVRLPACFLMARMPRAEGLRTFAWFVGSCGFVCQSSYSCVSGVCTNTNFGKKLLEFPSEETGDEAAEDMEGALAEA